MRVGGSASQGSGRWVFSAGETRHGLLPYLHRRCHLRLSEALSTDSPFLGENYQRTENMSATFPSSVPGMRPRLIITASFSHHSFHILLRRDFFSIREGRVKGLPSAGPPVLLNISSFTEHQIRQGHCGHSASVQNHDGSSHVHTDNMTPSTPKDKHLPSWLVWPSLLTSSSLGLPRVFPASR